MKISNKYFYPINFNIKSSNLKEAENIFEKYLKIALSELDTQKFLHKMKKKKSI